MNLVLQTGVVVEAPDFRTTRNGSPCATFLLRIQESNRKSLVIRVNCYESVALAAERISAQDRILVKGELFSRVAGDRSVLEVKAHLLTPLLT